MLKIFVLFLLIGTLHAITKNTLVTLITEDIPFHGVTIFKEPFVEKDNATGELRGFFVDLLDEMAQVGKFNYTLNNYHEQSTYTPEHYPSRLVNEVINNRADFGIADSLYKNDIFVRYSWFTQPYITSGLSVLVKRSLLERDNITSFEELMEKTKPDNRTDGSDIMIGTVGTSAVFRMLTTAIDPISRSVYAKIIQNPVVLVSSQEEGVRRAAEEPYAFIQEQFQNELEVNKNCDLIHLPIKPSSSGVEAMKDSEYSLVVRKYYLYLDDLNDALKKIKENGKLEEIRRKYFNRKCD